MFRACKEAEGRGAPSKHCCCCLQADVSRLRRPQEAKQAEERDYSPLPSQGAQAQPITLPRAGAWSQESGSARGRQLHAPPNLRCPLAIPAEVTGLVFLAAEALPFTAGF